MCHVLIRHLLYEINCYRYSAKNVQHRKYEPLYNITIGSQSNKFNQIVRTFKASDFWLHHSTLRRYPAVQQSIGKYLLLKLLINDVIQLRASGCFVVAQR